MPSAEVPLRVKLLVFLLFFLGFAVNLLAFLDAEWFHYVLRAAEPAAARGRGETAQTVDHLKQGIFNVQVAACDDQGVHLGTAFVVKAGYLATAAHVVADHKACKNEIHLLDYKGLPHSAQLAAYSEDKDLALLTIADTSLPALPLADSSSYETPAAVVRVFTIGYPLPGAASSVERASISGEGTLSQYDKSTNFFITSGLNLNAGNSGGPVFIADSLQVLGIAKAKMEPTVGEGIGHVIPIDTFKTFFHETSGQSLP
jgi:S1-C subfamily serine protease